MTHRCRRLLRLYPADVRGMYEQEMVSDFTVKLAAARKQGRLATIRFLVRELQGAVGSHRVLDATR